MKYYTFFTANALPQSNAAHLVHDVHSANAVANLGYPTILAYYRLGLAAWNPIDWVLPFRPSSPPQDLISYYQVQENLQAVQLSMPLSAKQGGKWTNPSTFACKYYFPTHILQRTQILHTLDWNLVKTAVRRSIPVIYEREHNQKFAYEPEIVNSPFFQVAVTVADSVRQNLIKNGMPPEKIVKLHLGYNKFFLERQPQQAEVWRQKLLTGGRSHLVVYAGGLYRFKGVDLLIDVAKMLPDVQFAIAGGDEAKVEAYRQRAREQQVSNISFIGYVLHQDLPGLLQAADVLAHPHLSGEAAEFTSPLKFFDYITSGAPIVASEIPPLMEFKGTNAVAAWCEPDDPGQFAQGVAQVLQAYPRRSGGFELKATILSDYSWENRISKILSYVDPAMLPVMSGSLAEIG
jgi:glycosyltransferase involved in cell wall biosynthesis